MMQTDEKDARLETAPKPPEEMLEVVMIDDEEEERERWKDKAGITVVPPRRTVSLPIIEEIDENGETRYGYGEEE